MPSNAITLTDEIQDLEREIKMREQVYPNQLHGITDPAKRQALREKHAHQLACSRQTLARLKALMPQQTPILF